MKPASSRPIHGIQAPAPRLTVAALSLIAVGFSITLLTILSAATVVTFLF